MKKLLILLLASTALLGGCKHVSVRHSVHVPLPIGVIEHRHSHNSVVFVHRHEGGHHAGHHHDRHDSRQVVVVSPKPVIRHRKVTVIERERQRRMPRRGHYTTEYRDRERHNSHPAQHERSSRHHDRDRNSQPREQERNHGDRQSRHVTPLPHAARHKVKRLPAEQHFSRSKTRKVVTKTVMHTKRQKPAVKPVPARVARAKVAHAKTKRRGEEKSGKKTREERGKQKGKSKDREKEEKNKGH
ncbi:MAG: hypothetical protein ABFS08_11655 [Pseudomonadota bacterium]